jgi:hypothetical protein
MPETSGGLIFRLCPIRFTGQHDSEVRGLNIAAFFRQRVSWTAADQQPAGFDVIHGHLTV